MEIQTMKGHCLCGQVSVEAHSVNSHTGACHCNMCRRWGGGPFMAVDCGTDVNFTGEDSISRYASSAWAERGFCANCGTHLFYHLKGKGQYMMPAGLFDAESQLVLDHQIFIEEKPAYYDFANDTHNMTGAEVFASVSSENE